MRVHGSDGREHIDYDLVITNGFTSELTLSSVTVRGGGRRLVSLAGELANFTHQTLGTEPTTTIPASSTVATLIDVVLPHSAERRVPKRLTTRIDYAVPAGAAPGAVIGSTTVRRRSRVDRRRPIVVASPLRGPGWLSANGCCADPTSPHRSLLLAADGWYVTPEMFAIDYIQVVGGRFYRGAGRRTATTSPTERRFMRRPPVRSSRRSTTAQRFRPGKRRWATRRSTSRWTSRATASSSASGAASTPPTRTCRPARSG
jgi:hypothetical protein